MKTPNERLMLFRTEVLHKTRKEFCEPLIMTDCELKNIEYGKTELKEKHIQQISEKYGVRREWLLDEEEPIQQEESVAFRIGKIASDAAHNSPEAAASFFRRFYEDFGEEELLLMYEIFKKRFPQYDTPNKEQKNED